MALHTDQSPEALKAVWKTGKERCPYCKESHGWWQGVVEASDQGPRFMCAICAAIRNRVPVPEGFIRLRISGEILETIGSKERFNEKYPVNTPTQTLQQAMPLLLAWMIENKLLNMRLLLDHQVDLAKPTIKDDKPHPMVLRRPVWWSTKSHVVLETEKYADSNEDREIHAVVRQVVGNPDWTRTVFTEAHGVFSPMESWSVGLDEKHPAYARGLAFVEVLPWYEIVQRGRVEMDGSEINAEVHHEPVFMGLIELIKSRIAPPEQPLWRALGLE